MFSYLAKLFGKQETIRYAGSRRRQYRSLLELLANWKLLLGLDGSHHLHDDLRRMMRAWKMGRESLAAAGKDPRPFLFPTRQALVRASEGAYARVRAGGKKILLFLAARPRRPDSFSLGTNIGA